MKTLPLLTFFSMLLPSCIPMPGAVTRGPSYRDELVSAVRKADSVRLIEQSHPMDFYQPGRKFDPDQPRRIYRQVSLSSRQAEALLAAPWSELPEWGDDVRTRCEFRDHHIVQFRKHGRTVSTLRICFQCGDIQWDRSDRLPPHSFLHSLHQIFAAKGFQPERDWQKLAEAH